MDVTAELTQVEEAWKNSGESRSMVIGKCLVRTMKRFLRSPTSESNISSFKDDNSFKLLCRIAYCMVCGGQKITERELFNELMRYGMASEDGLNLMGIAAIHNGYLEFFHPTAMEFLAAVHLAQCSSNDIAHFAEEFFGGNVLQGWKIMRFLFYLTGSSKCWLRETTRVIPEIVACLCEAVVCSSDGFVNDTAFLDVLCCIHEFQDPRLAVRALDVVVQDKTLVYPAGVAKERLPALAYFLATVCRQGWRVYSSDQELASQLMELVRKLDGSLLVDELCGLPSIDGGVLYVTKLSLRDLALLTATTVNEDLALFRNGCIQPLDYSRHRLRRVSHSDSRVLRVHSGLICDQRSFAEAYYHPEAKSEEGDLPFSQSENVLMSLISSEEETGAKSEGKKDEMVVPKIPLGTTDAYTPTGTLVCLGIEILLFCVSKTDLSSQKL